MKSNFTKWFDRALIGLSIVVVAGVVGFAGWFIFAINQEETPNEPNVIKEKAVDVEVKTPVEEEITVDVEAGTNEFVFQQQLHEMTHQKVYADDKWGATQITDALIDDMIATLEREMFENEAFYLEVLTAWNEGNFDNAVDAHNEIWSLQGGSIGQATRLLTPQEEKDYIEIHFDKPIFEDE